MKTHILPVRLSDVEYEGIVNASIELGVSKAEVIRRFYWTIRVLYSDQITLREALTNIDDIDCDKPLSAMLRNIPELLIAIIDKNKK